MLCQIQEILLSFSDNLDDLLEVNCYFELTDSLLLILSDLKLLIELDIERTRVSEHRKGIISDHTVLDRSY